MHSKLFDVEKGVTAHLIRKDHGNDSVLLSGMVSREDAGRGELGRAPSGEGVRRVVATTSHKPTAVDAGGLPARNRHQPLPVVLAATLESLVNLAALSRVTN